MKKYFERRIIAIFLMGISSGIPLALTGSTLSAWLKDYGITKATIGLFASVGTPYALKFLWAPLMDHVRIPFLLRFGKRRSWLILLEILLALTLAAIAFIHPAMQILHLAALSLIVSTLSATQDIVIDAYRVELLKPEEQELGAPASVFGYRMGMIISGAGALMLADAWSWQAAYLTMAFVIPCGLIGAFIAREDNQNNTPARSLDFKSMLLDPFMDFGRRQDWALILIFVILFKLGDAFSGVMTNVFYLELGFTKTQIGQVVKVYGLVATIMGAYAYAVISGRLGLYRGLYVAGVLQAVTLLAYIFQHHMGNNIYALCFTVTVENFASGVGTAALIAYISKLCNRDYTATQYALLSSLAAFGRTWLSTPSGLFAEKLGWDLFFIISFLVSLPALLVLRRIEKNNRQNYEPA